MGTNVVEKKSFEYDEDGNIIHEQTYEMDTTRGGRDNILKQGTSMCSRINS